MAHTVVLHIGAMKSGTSFIQQCLDANRAVLAEQGAVFPGESWRQQVLAVLDVLDQQRDGKRLKGSRGAWQRLVEEVSAWDGRAVVSMEFLGPAPTAKIRALVDSLAPARVEVVMTVRDLARNVPAMWQEAVKNRAEVTWTDYCRDIEDAEEPSQPHAKSFWRHMAYPRIAQRWSEVVGPDRLTVVTVPPDGSPPEVLWRRFCQAAGLDPAPFDLSGRSNASVGAASAEVLRRLNVALPDDLPLKRYQKVVKHRLAREGLSSRRSDETTIGFTADWLTRRSAVQIERLAGLGVRVVGDLDELRPVTREGADPGQTSTEEQLEAAVEALAYLVRVWPNP